MTAKRTVLSCCLNIFWVTCSCNNVGLFLLGTINNLPYVIVTSAASTIADSFGKKNLIGLVFGANVALSALVKTINGGCCLEVKYWIRYVINALLMLIGLFGVAYAPSFWFSLVCIVFVGSSSAFGENVALGYLRLFPSKMVNAWSSGTGMAGVLGSVLYIAFGCIVGAGGDNQKHLRNLVQDQQCKMVNAWSNGTGMASVLGSVLYIAFGCIVGAGGDNQKHLRNLVQYRAPDKRDQQCKMVNAWSSGTGMAGVLGSVLYIAFGCIVGAGGDNQKHLRNLVQYAFLLTSPAVVLYLVSYFFIIKAPGQSRNADDETERKPIIAEEQIVLKALPIDNILEFFKLERVADDETGDDKDEIMSCTMKHRKYWDKGENSGSAQADDTKESVFARWWRCTKLVSWMSINLCAVYLFEYVAQGCASKVRPSSEYHKGCPELYAGLSLCYQAGVFVSRSSVQLVHIRRVEYLSLLQGINMVLWVVDVHYKFLPTAILPTLMIYVGLLGGASYVNIFYNLLHDSKYPEKDRELCINITALFITLGIISGTVLETILFNTVLKSD